MVQRFGTEIRLQENQLYTVTVKVKGQEKVVSFTSRYNPLFSTVRIIRSDFRDLFSIYADDDINRLIHDNSKLAMELTATATTAVVVINPNVANGIPYAAKQYVRYKTELDLATDVFLTLSTKGGQEDKQLADMRVMKQVQAPYVDSILKVLQQRFASWEAQLIGTKVKPTSAVRAGGTVYPRNGRVSF